MNFDLSKKNYNFRVFYVIAFFGLLFSPMGAVAFPFLPVDEPLFQEAFAQEFEEYTVRNQTSVTTMYSETRGSVTMGLPEHILDNQGDWVANLFIEDSTGVQLESGTITYFYDKIGCGMTQYETGRIISGETSPIIKSNSWAVKVAPNGTDNWIDISQNFLPCEVSTTISGNMITLNSTRSDSKGTITEIWDYTKYEGLKQTIWFTNNDTSYTNHKFHFSNIMEDTPKSFVLASLNSTDNSIQANGYSMYPSGFIPPLMSDSTIILNVTSGETIQFDYNDMFLFNATTGNTTTITDSFTWIDKDQGFMNYDFDLGIEQLWAIKFIANTDNTLDVYVDYANVDQPLAVGSTMMLDPTVQPPETDYMRVLSTAFTATGGACGQGWASATIDGGFTTFRTGGKETCGNPVFKYDITAIPDTATPLSMTYEILVVDNSDSAANSGFLNGGGHVRPIILEDIFFASTTDIGDIIFNNGAGGAGAIMFSSGNGFDVTDWFVTPDHSLHNGIGNTGIMTNTRFILSGTTNQFEIQLESGRNFYILVWCNNISSSCSAGTNTASGTNFMTFDPNGTFLTVEFEQFQPPSAPQAPITATFTPTPDSCFVDWNPPLDTGGRPITGYQVERSTGGSFQIIVADTGGSLPTSHDDTTIIAGTSNTYQISAITLEGVGVPSIVSNGCGVPVEAGDPFLQTLTNVGVGLVALDWLAPVFDGNDPVTGYKIERTEGTPFTDKEWQFIQHKRESVDTVTQGDGVRILDVGDQTGFLRLQGVGDTTVEGVMLSSNINSGRIGNTYLFKDFAKEDIINRSIEWRWDQFKKAAGFSLQTFGSWETRSYIADGVFDMTGANTVGGTGDFPSEVAGLGSEGLHFPSVGNGIIYDCFDNVAENAPTSITLGSTPTDTVLPTISQMEGANQHQVACQVDLLPSASQDRVTVVLMIFDAQTGLIGCGSNCASHEIGSIVVDFINIVGLGNWDFVNDIPIGTVITFDPPSSNDNGFGILNTNVVGNFDILKFVIGDGFITLVADTGNTQTEFIDNTVTESTNFGYRVSAINGQGVGEPSNVLAILTAGAPSPPVITATATGTTSINIDWTTPDLNEGTLIEYELERKLGTAGFFTTLDTTTNTEFDDGTGLFALQSDVEYCYQVKTITNVGESAFSIESCATTFAAPSEVENLQVIALDGSSVNMSFDDPLSDGGSPITGFQIEQKIGAGSFQIVQVSNSLNQVRNDTGFPIGTLITYKVIPFNQFGGGDQAQASDTTDATPQAPPNFTCSATSSTSLTLDWNTPQTFTTPTGYLIDRKTVSGAFSTLVADTADTATFFVDDGLPVDSIFQYRILAHTPEGDTDFTPTITCSTLGSPDFPPEDLQGDFTATIPHQMVLAWDIPDTFGVPINSFRVERDDGAGFNEIASVSGSTFLFIDQDPNNAITQKYRIFTVGSEGDSPPSIAIPFSANQTSHWHYEKSLDDTGENKNAGAITGTANFNNTGQVGLGHTFDGSTYITVADESDYDHDKDVSFGMTTYYKGVGGNVTPVTDDWHWAFMIHDVGGFVSNEVTQDTQFTNLEQLAGGFTQGVTWFYKTFDKNEINGKDFIITWEGTGTIHRALVKIYDGEYLPSAGLSDFPAKAGCNGCAEFDPVLKDSGKLQFSTTKTSAFTLTTETLFTINTASSTNANDKVTVFVYYQDKESAAVSTGRIGIDKIEIQNLGVWNFGSNAGATILGNTPVTCTTFSPLFADSCGTNNALSSIFSEEILVAKATSLTSTGYKLFIESGFVGLKLTNTDTTNEISVVGNTNVYDDVFHFIGAGYNGNGTASGVSLMVDGVFETKTVLFDNLSGSILNNEPLTLGASSLGTTLLNGTLDETRFFGSGTLDDATLQAIAEDSITTVIPIVATITIAGTTFADISSETPLIIMTSGFPLPTIGTIDLQNFTATTVNTQAVGLVIDGVNGQFILDPSLFNIMGSLSNYTAISSLTNSEEVFPLLSNFDLQTPLFTFSGDFFFQQQRNTGFDILSFNYTQTIIPFDLDCNFKSTLFGNGTTVEFNDVFFVQLLQPVPVLEDVVVACIDPNQPIADPTAPSFGGINTILSFVSFGDTTGIGNFLQFTNNYGDFFGVGLPFLFVIILAAAFTGRSAPTGILIIAIAIGIMAALGILEVDPFMWGIIVVLVILGVLGGKKFL